MPNFFIKFIHKVYHSEKNYIYFKCSYESYEKTKSLLSFNFKIKFLNFKEKIIIVNRLILVGNGFDLAHGLKTSYKDFIDDFWEDVIFKLNMFKSDTLLFSNECIEISQDPFPTIDISNFKEIVKNYTKLKRFLSTKKIRFEFKNEFLGILSDTCTNNNWVDIENIYYYYLKQNIEKNKYPKFSDVSDLNKDFNQIKNLLEVYLSKINKNFNINNQVSKHITNDYNLKDIESKHLLESIRKIQEKCKSLVTLYDSKYKEDLKNIHYLFHDETNDLSDENKLDNENLENLNNNETEVMLFNINKTLILNFNYTNTIFEYINEFNRIKGNKTDYEISEIHIHGELNNSQNPIIFGFGDDVDKKYQEFEDLNDNRYLENFKSIAYLQTDNYKKLLEFIDSEEYQVFIFGHSCGISDRTMLNTIFEHDNCKSIKPFYHLKKDGTDNYTEIVQNISRNFNDKKKYRDRVVNKTYCEPLTQSI